jgi:hypothetical protein
VSAKTNAKRVLIVLGALLLLGYLFLSRSAWFSELKRQAKVGRDQRSTPIDIARTDTVTWKINGEDWKYTGECKVALVLDRLSDAPPEAYRKNSMALKLKVDAYAVTYQPTGPGTRIEGFQAPRLIRNSYYTTNMPLSTDAHIWESWGESIELGLCGLQRYPFEDTYIAVEILQPDPVLAKANPRLMIVGEHDYAIYGHLPTAQTLRDVVLLVLAVCVIGLTYAAFKRV